MPATAEVPEAASRWDDSSAERLLQALAAGDGAIPAMKVAVVVAHPDDETIGLGGQMSRLADPTIIHITDGAPRNGLDARAHGFDGPEAYAKARRGELEAAMAVAGLLPDALVSLAVPDQEASFRLSQVAHDLAGLFRERGTDVVFTHAFEGGHPDHDATAFAVHAASRMLPQKGGPAVIEMPFYNLGSSDWATQRFLPAAGVSDVEIRLDDEQRRRKQRMIDAHRTQAGVLSTFSTEVERFRPAPRYDFARLPNEGRLLYEQYGWGMTGDRWQALARTALAELGLEAGA